MEKQSRRDKIEESYVDYFGKKPEIWTRAPGRVDLMGSHTDYNEGFVLTMTIDRDIWLAAAPRTDRKVCIRSLDISGKGEFDLDHLQYDPENPWTNYIRGVVWAAKERRLPLVGFDGLIHSTVPLGSGVSSSAALEASVGVLLRGLGGWSISNLDLALLCQQAENEFVGLNCGILDQYSSILGEDGSAILLDCRHLTSKIVPIHEDIRVVICDTRKKRALTGSEYPDRRAQCERAADFFSDKFADVHSLRDVSLEQFNLYKNQLDAITQKRAQFIIEENQRVLAMESALRDGKHHRIADLTRQSYLGARDYFEIGSPEYEKMMAAMLSAPGVIGARQAGAGFGGCMAAFIHKGQVAEFCKHVKRHYLASTTIDPHVYAVEAVNGAGLLTFTNRNDS